jgi:hypothetical protein
MSAAGALCVLLSLSGQLSPSPDPAVYYVATTGSDSYPGTSDYPFRTIQRAVDAAGPGDTILVRDGTYLSEHSVTCGDGCDQNRSPVVIRKSGAPDMYITLRSENKWAAVLDCELQCDSYINLAAGSGYLAIEDFVFTRGFWEGIHSNDDAHHIVIRGNRFEYIGNRATSTRLGISGLYTNPACHDFVISGNVFHDIGRLNPSILDHALYLHGTNFIVANNLFYNLKRGWPIQLADGLRNALIANNTFAFANQEADGQIMLWDRQANVSIRNNIFYGPRSEAITRYSSTVEGCDVSNNVVYGDAVVMRDARGCVVLDNRAGSDPKFANAVSPPYDFRLLSGSDAIDAGAPIDEVTADHAGIRRPQGGRYDAGAFEYVPRDRRDSETPRRPPRPGRTR